MSYSRQEIVNLFGTLHELDPNRQMFREHFDLRRVHHLMRSKARHRPACGRTRNAFGHEKGQDSFIERLKMILRVFVEIDRDFLRHALFSA